jgi:hypothetical protein
MTVVVAPVHDLRFRFVVACAIDRIAASLGLRPDEVVPSPWFVSRLEHELREPHGRVRVSVVGGIVVVEDEHQSAQPTA